MQGEQRRDLPLGRTPDCWVEKSRGDRLGGSEPGEKGEDLLGGGR